MTSSRAHLYASKCTCQGIFEVECIGDITEHREDAAAPVLAPHLSSVKEPTSCSDVQPSSDATESSGSTDMDSQASETQFLRQPWEDEDFSALDDITTEKLITITVEFMQ